MGGQRDLQIPLLALRHLLAQVPGKLCSTAYAPEIPPSKNTLNTLLLRSCAGDGNDAIIRKALSPRICDM